ncbi:hypothetical protein Pmar_PMAR024169 [Perkinsus marinus ATCC 50983]|uniref:Uncharacterized protein n=1 Tax=Perkinsus marinus (strain ATCC 50983 / TXsc) TaxID=423536 RepID=C5L2D3_PERM5|nr:hypothetical protein Pmar_PMAR024169 [Perkinsus marinus ATCC 50983]EER09145.1 hypothetical protein Pmar_PMAR024169 [Perkinsus marinus ATCC 50983]|eukprot:XP_002777329.1 hypothetical protein Pmar_PMAR024169 [Perkinsus marinus ATCC 50983]
MILEVYALLEQKLINAVRPVKNSNPLQRHNTDIRAEKSLKIVNEHAGGVIGFSESSLSTSGRMNLSDRFN